MSARAEEFRMRELPAPVFFVLYAGATAVGLAGGFLGSFYAATLTLGGSALTFGAVAGLGVVLGGLIGGVQTLAVFRASGRGKAWAPATALGAAAGMPVFLLLFDLSAFTQPVLGLLPCAALGAIVGAAQWLAIRRAWWLLHVGGCVLALLPWFPILALFSSAGNVMAFYVAPALAGLVAGLIASAVLWLSIRLDAPRPPPARAIAIAD